MFYITEEVHYSGKRFILSCLEMVVVTPTICSIHTIKCWRFRMFFSKIFYLFHWRLFFFAQTKFFFLSCSLWIEEGKNGTGLSISSNWAAKERCASVADSSSSGLLKTALLSDSLVKKYSEDLRLWNQVINIRYEFLKQTKISNNPLLLTPQMYQEIPGTIWMISKVILTDNFFFFNIMIKLVMILLRSLNRTFFEASLKTHPVNTGSRR